MKVFTINVIAGLVLAFSVGAKDTVNPHYSALLNNSMWFYEAQRSGELPKNNRVPWYAKNDIFNMHYY
jgi:endoglucanase